MSYRDTYEAWLASPALSADEKAELEATRAELAAIEEDLKIKRQEADAILIELNAKDDILEDLLEKQHDADEALQKEIAQAEKAYNEQKRKEEEGKVLLIERYERETHRRCVYR